MFCAADGSTPIEAVLGVNLLARLRTVKELPVFLVNGACFDDFHSGKRLDFDEKQGRAVGAEEIRHMLATVALAREVFVAARDSLKLVIWDDNVN